LDSSPSLSKLTFQLETALNDEALSELGEDANLSVVIGSVFASLNYMELIEAGRAGDQPESDSLTSDARAALWASWRELVGRSTLDWRRLLVHWQPGW